MLAEMVNQSTHSAKAKKCKTLFDYQAAGRAQGRSFQSEVKSPREGNRQDCACFCVKFEATAGPSLGAYDGLRIPFPTNSRHVQGSTKIHAKLPSHQAGLLHISWTGVVPRVPATLSNFLVALSERLVEPLHLGVTCRALTAVALLGVCCIYRGLMKVIAVRPYEREVPRLAIMYVYIYVYTQYIYI